MPVLDASTPLLLFLPPHMSSIPHSVVCLQSSLILDGTLPSKLGKSTLLLPPLPISLPSVLFSFHFSFSLQFCVPLALKRGIKWPWISQEVGVSSWFQETCGARGKKGNRKKGHDEMTSSSWSPSLPLVFANWLSPRLFSSDPSFFQPTSFLPPSRSFFSLTFSRG